MEEPLEALMLALLLLAAVLVSSVIDQLVPKISSPLIPVSYTHLTLPTTPYV